ncbi:hypothetical protein MKX01_012875 [Papaver californicum]|nr:hypothetical protein MKX01_012875 [Papaver californicum]
MCTSGFTDFSNGSSPLESTTSGFSNNAGPSIQPAVGSTTPASLFADTNTRGGAGLINFRNEGSSTVFGSPPGQPSPLRRIAFGSSAHFGAPSQPLFGTSSSPGFGVTNTPAFGAATTSAFESQPTAGFGTATTSVFVSRPTSTFGSGGGFGTPAFGSTSNPAFGVTTAASTFGKSTTPFAAQPFKRALHLAKQILDFVTLLVQLRLPLDPKVLPSMPLGRHVLGVGSAELESISAMPVYKEKSHEELRLEDYQLSHKSPFGSRSHIGATFSFPSTGFGSAPFAPSNQPQSSIFPQGGGFQSSMIGPPRFGAQYSTVPASENTAFKSAEVTHYPQDKEDNKIDNKKMQDLRKAVEMECEVERRVSAKHIAFLTSMLEKLDSLII